MSVQITKAVLHEFLTNDEHDVLALTGAWGTGKTYAWREALMGHKDSIKFKHYCYVSLFGISSMDELRMALFIKLTDVATLGTTPDSAVINEHWADVSKDWLKGQYGRFASAVKNLPHRSNVSLGFEVLAPSAVRDTLVCFDDFERQTTLKPEDVLGLITELKEERGCKVALIFNAEQLGAKDAYRTYKEKVVDCEVLHAPTVHEAFDLVFDSHYPHRDQLLRHVVDLGITNIRILRKLRGVLNKMEAATAGLHTYVVQQSIATTTLLCWSAYGVDADKPPIEQIGTWNENLMGHKQEQDAEDPAWVRRIKEYGFAHVDDTDLAIARVVQRGYAEGTGFPELARKADADFRARDKMEAFSEIWRRFHNSFTDDPDDFVKQLHATAREGVGMIGAGDLNATVVLLRQLKRDDLADDLIRAYVETHKGEPDTFNLFEHPSGGSLDDPGLRKAFDTAHAALRKLPSLEESTTFIIDNGGYNKEHIESMKAASIDDYYDLFTKPHSGEKLSQLIMWTLRFNNGDQSVIAEKAREALKRVKSINPLNEIRVSKYGV